ncbi:DNA-binding CsgD family transcriptional regulator/tetratricopeptide (TPR) repeat protein [Amycolatopsis thermophila]|uniref:DNA-binding CsgD family transcriptional regulator/tetratricopeptide (TPR) repeat protein n=1 Tax=Amycolatopsis thermophila TaxID=206084 RepID=A0ABU0EXR8_9PSEU|nr:DNA-binding CsgD family transcriptional regulator/tetratricopeptide (TPR) repeat protein [Amycolatopsis thermophila]
MPRLGSGIPLVARTDEMRRLRAAFAAAERGEAGAVLVSGDAGVGKTRLLTELAEHAASRGALVLTGRCLDVREGGLPYLPFAEALAPLSLDEDPVVAEAVRVRPALARLLPQGAMPPAPDGEYPGPDTSGERDVPYRVRQEQDLGQLQLFDAVLGLLTQVAAHRPVVLVLEDLHWADSSSRNLVSFLLNRLRTQRLLVVASYREEDVHRRHPLRALLVEMVRLPAVEQVELRPFGTAEARAFVEALADGPLSPEILAGVAERSEGNPFFAEELMAAGVECRDLPAGLAEVLLARLERLSPEARRVVRTISAAGDSVAHAALAEVTGLDELELDEALREAVHHHVLVIERGAYTFRHALLQEAVYADLLPGERVRMHGAYAARIERTPQGRGHDAKLAYHSLRSRDLTTALPALLRAAEEAERLGAPGAALRHIEQALEIWDAVPEAERPADVGELKLLQEASYFAATSGEPERAIAYGRSAVQNLGPDVPAEKAAKAWRRLAEVLLNAEGTLDEARAAINRAWELVAEGEPSKTRAWVLATRAAILRNAGQYEDSSWNAHTAVADARAVGATGAEAAALVTLGALADSAGEPEEARERLREAERKAVESGSLNVGLRAVCFLAFSHEDLGEYGAAMEIYQRGIERAEQTGLTWSIYGLEMRARHLTLRYLTGDWPAMASTNAPARGVSSVLAARMTAAWLPFAVARGRVATAEKYLEELRPHWRAEPLTAIVSGATGAELAFWQGEYQQALAWVHKVTDFLLAFDEGYLLATVRLGALGVEAAASWAATARRRGDEGLAAQAAAAGRKLIEHVRHAGAHGKPRARTLGPEGRAWLARAEAAASGLDGPADPSLWAVAVAAFDYGAVYEQAVCRWHHAEALLASHGDAGLAAKELLAAHEVAERLRAEPLRDAVREVARRARVDLPGVAPEPRPRPVVDPLTGRERAVLERVALGRTNKQVGEELYISEKTVSVHLSRVMAKLGASRRAEAVAIAYDRGLLT